MRKKLCSSFIYNLWTTSPIAKKTGIYSFSVFALLLVTLIGAVSIASYAVTTSGSILWNVTRCSAIQNALIDEESALRSLTASRSETNRQDYEGGLPAHAGAHQPASARLQEPRS